MLRVGKDSPAACGSAQESNAREAYALSEAHARDEREGDDVTAAIYARKSTGQSGISDEQRSLEKSR